VITLTEGEIVDAHDYRAFDITSHSDARHHWIMQNARRGGRAARALHLELTVDEWRSVPDRPSLLNEEMERDFP
jgi:hypothetical protein